MNFFKKKRPGLQRSQSRWRFGTRSARNFKERVLNVGQRPLSVNDDPDFGQANQEPQVEFVANQIKSSKYTIITFLPRYECLFQNISFTTLVLQKLIVKY